MYKHKFMYLERSTVFFFLLNRIKHINNTGIILIKITTSLFNQQSLLTLYGNNVTVENRK